LPDCLLNPPSFSRCPKATSFACRV